MAIFFIASGYCYSAAKSDSVKSLWAFVKRKSVTLWFPYVLWGTVNVLLFNFFLKINIYTGAPEFLNYANTPYDILIAPTDLHNILKNIVGFCLLRGTLPPMASAMWFLAVLMEVSIGYAIVDFLLKKLFGPEHVLFGQTIISLVLLAVGFLGCMLMRSFRGFAQPASDYILFHGGYLIKLYAKDGKPPKDMRWPFRLLLLACSWALLFGLMHVGELSLATNDYPNPAFFLAASFGGWVFCYELCWFLSKVSVLQKLLCLAGQNTLYVVALNFLVFKLINLLGVLAKGLPLCVVAGFPVYFMGGAWWVAYMAVGLVIPISLSLLWKKLKRSVAMRGQ